MRRFTSLAVLVGVVLGGASGAQAWWGQDADEATGRGRPGPAPVSGAVEESLGYQGLTLGEFPAFQTFAFQGESGTFGMAWRTHRHILERRLGKPDTGWARGLSDGQGLGYYLDDEKWKLIAAMRKDQRHSLSERSFGSVSQLEKEITRRLEGKEIRHLVFTIDSTGGRRRRYLILFRARTIEDQGETGRVYDFYDPHAPTDEAEVAGALEMPVEELPANLRGGRFGQLRVLPDSGLFQVSFSWAATADAGTALGQDGDDVFARLAAPETAWADVEVQRFGVADKGRFGGLWGGSDTPYLDNREADRARGGFGSALEDFRRNADASGTPAGLEFGTCDEAD